MNTQELFEKFSLKGEGENVEFKNLGKLDSVLPDLLTYISDAKYFEEALAKDNLRVLIVPSDFDQDAGDFCLIKSEDPKHEFYRLHKALFEETEFYGRDYSSEIDDSAKIHPTAFVSDLNVRIGKNVVIGPNVTVLSGVEIGDNVIVQPGTVIGSEGFECYRKEQDLISVVHAGRVKIADDVVIGANCTFDKGIFNEDTVVGRSTKFDNMVHVAHGVKIGERVFFPAGITLSGYITIEDDVWIGVGSTILQRLNIGKGSKISIGSVVTKDVKEGAHVTGNFAIEHSRFIAGLKKLL